MCSTSGMRWSSSLGINLQQRWAWVSWGPARQLLKLVRGAPGCDLDALQVKSRLTGPAGLHQIQVLTLARSSFSPSAMRRKDALLLHFMSWWVVLPSAGTAN